jgi:hypothetical protein
MTERDKLWHQQYEQLVEFQRTNGHCLVPIKKYEQDKSLGLWVMNQRNVHKNNTMRPDREGLLDEIGFAWKAEGATNTNDKLWLEQYEKLVEFKRKTGHCLVPRRYEQDKSLGTWVSKQWTFHKKNKMRPDRKDLLDKIGFAWKYITLAARSSANDVRGLVTGLVWPEHVSHSTSSCSAYLCRIRSRKRSPGPAVWVSSQTKHHPKNRNQHKTTLVIIVQLPTERDQVPALPKPDKRASVVQTKEAMLRLAVVVGVL